MSVPMAARSPPLDASMRSTDFGFRKGATLRLLESKCCKIGNVCRTVRSGVLGRIGPT